MIICCDIITHSGGTLLSEGVGGGGRGGEGGGMVEMGITTFHIDSILYKHIYHQSAILASSSAFSCLR